LQINSVLANDTPQVDSDISESSLEYCQKINETLQNNEEERPLALYKNIFSEKQLLPFEKSLYKEYHSKTSLSKEFLAQVRFIRDTCKLSQDAQEYTFK
jgi:hypothetical protein